MINKEVCVKDTQDTATITANVSQNISLWKAVILQSLIDLASNSKKKIAQSYRFKALKWFSPDNKDFLRVCSLADLDPMYVLDKVKAIKLSSKYLIF